MIEPSTPGWDRLSGWFGGPVSLHDAELISVQLNARQLPSTFDFDATNLAGEHRQIRFTFWGISRLKFQDWWEQNVALEVCCNKLNDGYSFTIDGSVGISVDIYAKKIEAEII